MTTVIQAVKFQVPQDGDGARLKREKDKERM